MSNVTSRVALEELVSTPSHNSILAIAIRQASTAGCKGQDVLSYFPTEIRLMIFRELLIVSPKAIYRGAKDFGPLDEREFDQEVPVPWQILATCRKYHQEAMPILYGENRLVFCTGEKGEPGMFWRFPIHVPYMHLLRDVGIFFRADDPKSQASKRVAHFLKALTRHATNLEYLTVMASSDRHYDAACPWDILFCDHPVCVALVQLVKKNTVKHLEVRLHDGACLFPSFGSYLNQTFVEVNGPITDRSITFLRSCTCPTHCAHDPVEPCILCGFPKGAKSTKPIEEVVYPAWVESGMERMMDLQDDLFHLGVLPPTDDDDDDDKDMESDHDDNYLSVGGPYRIPIDDDYEDTLPAFYSGFLFPEKVRHYRGELKASKVWSYRQTELTDFFRFVEYGEYCEAVFRRGG